MVLVALTNYFHGKRLIKESGQEICASIKGLKKILTYSFGCLVQLWSAWIKGIPYILHESKTEGKLEMITACLPIQNQYL
jgi:hypothetical protein